MTNDFRMSYFMPPIAPIKNEQGRIVTPATLIPSCEVSVEQVFQIITCNENLKILTEQVRNSGDIRTAKASLLPYVTPCGTFSRRNSKCSYVYVPSAAGLTTASFTPPLVYPPGSQYSGHAPSSFPDGILILDISSIVTTTGFSPK